LTKVHRNSRDDDNLCKKTNGRKMGKLPWLSLRERDGEGEILEERYELFF